MSNCQQHLDRIKAGIAPYTTEREMIERFLKEPKSQDEFDKEFGDYPTGKFREEGLPGDGLMLGSFMQSYGHLTWWIDLLQHMVLVGDVIQIGVEGKAHYQTKPAATTRPHLEDYPLIPNYVVEAAQLVSKWFVSQGLKGWRIMGVADGYLVDESRVTATEALQRQPLETAAAKIRELQLLADGRRFLLDAQEGRHKEEVQRLEDALAMARQSLEKLAFNTAQGFNSQQDEQAQLHADVKELISVCVMVPDVKQDRAIEAFLAKHPELA